MSGAYMTFGSYGGMVRGCAACKMPLAADLSCPRCGPREVRPSGTLWNIVQELGIPPKDPNACELCGYHVHAKTCPTLTPEGWRAVDPGIYDGAWVHSTGARVYQVDADRFCYGAIGQNINADVTAPTLLQACAAALKAHVAKTSREMRRICGEPAKQHALREPDEAVTRVASLREKFERAQREVEMHQRLERLGVPRQSLESYKDFYKW